MTIALPQPRADTPARSTVRPANRLALQITGRPYVSHSQLSLMRACPRKFAFQYVENAPRDFVPVSLLYGGSIHAGIEGFYRGLLEGIVIDAKEMLHIYHLAWEENRRQAGKDVPVRYGVKEDEAAVHTLARNTIDAFLASPLATPKGNVVGVEEELRVVLDRDLPEVLTRVDLVTSTESALHVTDFKTSRSKWTAEKAIEAGDQLLLYASATAGMAESMQRPVKLSFAVLTKAKSPQVQVLPVPTDPARVKAVKDASLQTWAAIVAGNYYPSPQPMNCSTCPFKSRCPAFGGSGASHGQ